MTTYGCPNCGRARAQLFHHISDIPVNSCLLFGDPGAAQALPTGDIDFAFCPDCAFIFNAAWKPDRTTYSTDYEETQGFSSTFNAFQDQQARDLIERYGVFDKDIVEIGCGKGEFLTLLCELGGNRGVGYDPSFVPERRAAGSADIVFKQEYFSGHTVQDPPDLICCRMTLEHISRTRAFVRAVRRIASPQRGTIVVFQVPDVRRILDEGAFWDIYYEHCSYFSPRSLVHVFQDSGFEVLRLSSEYHDQYLTIEARPSTSTTAVSLASEGEDLIGSVGSFEKAVKRVTAQWASTVRAIAQSGGRVVLWGSGSKAVAFLSAVGDARRHIQYLVDINPHRWGKFVPGTVKQIVGPEFLTQYQPDLVIAMNPVYRQEITADLRRLGCSQAKLLALGESKSKSATMHYPTFRLVRA
jgi:SAM-dependent methyltransferase